MNQKKHFALYTNAISAMLLAGCMQSTQPVQTSTVSTQIQASVAASIASDELTVSKLGGVPLDSANGEFCIGWNEFVGPLSENSDRTGNASVVVFDSLNTTPERRTPRAGEDIGTVYLNYSTNHQAFEKIQKPFGGTFYAVFARLFNESAAGVSFSGNATYEFEVTGSPLFSPAKATIVAPPALITITSQMNGQRVSPDGDLVVTWSGGAVGGNILVRATPMIIFGSDGFAPCDSGSERDEYGRIRRGRIDRIDGMPPGIHRGEDGDAFRIDTGFVELLPNNPGRVVIPASAIQQLLVGASRVSITVSEFSSSKFSHDNGTYRVVMRDGDRRMLIVK